MLPSAESRLLPTALRQLRQQHGMTQRQLADRLGIDVSNIVRYEKPRLEDGPARMQPVVFEKLNAIFFKDEVQSAQFKDFFEESSSSIKNHTVEELIDELKRRGAKSVQISW